jgi:hypothetical protein
MGGCFLDKQSKAKQRKEGETEPRLPAVEALTARVGVRARDFTRFRAGGGRWRCAARHRVDRCPMGDGFRLSLARASSPPTC